MNILKEHFDKSAHKYDYYRQLLIPHSEIMNSVIMSRLSFDSDSNIRILDLGCGTGYLSKYISEAYSMARIDLFDISEAMLTKAKENLGDSARFQFKVMPFLELNIREKYDAVISSLSIHHLENDDKIKLNALIYKSLVPGGWFINIDLVKAPDEKTDKLYDYVWEQDAIKTGLNPASLEKVKRPRIHDHEALLSDNLQWLRDCGFIYVDVFYKYFRFSVFGGQRLD